MKILRISAVAMVLAIFAYVSVQAKDNAKETPPWMEDVKVDGRRSTYLVPKGAKREIIGSQVIVEPINEFVARRIYEMELYVAERFEQIEDNQSQLKIELDALKKALESIEQKLSEKENLEEKNTENLE